jgi:membrane protein
MGWLEIFKNAGIDFLEDKASQLGAALAYYTIFSLAPLLLIAIAITRFVFGETTAKDEIMTAITETIGPKGAEIIQTMLENAARPKAGKIATIIGIGTMIFGSLGVFTQLKSAMNTVWEVAPKPSPGIWYYIKTYVLSFGLVLAIGFLLLLSILATTALSVSVEYFKTYLPNASLWTEVNLVVSFAIVTLLFAIIFKTLPDAQVRWRDIWPGAMITAILFTVGKYALGWYFAYGATGSTFGAAGSLVVLLVWVYWSSQILLFGAEVTQVYANSRGSGMKPKSYAMKVP